MDNIRNKVIKSIQDEWETISYYNDLIDDLEADGDYDGVDVIDDINREEHTHVGQLQSLLQTMGGDLDSIEEGEEEGEEQLEESLQDNKMENDFEKQINEFIEESRGYTDYDGIVQGVADEFDLPKEDAEQYVWNYMYTIGHDVNSMYDESLNESLIDPTLEDIEAFEEIIAYNDFDIEKKGKTLFGNIHYQIIDSQAAEINSQEDVRERIENFIEDIDKFEEDYNIPVTWNFGVNDEGILTAGIDLREKYVEDNIDESLKESYVPVTLHRIKDAPYAEDIYSTNPHGIVRIKTDHGYKTYTKRKKNYWVRNTGSMRGYEEFNDQQIFDLVKNNKNAEIWLEPFDESLKESFDPYSLKGYNYDDHEIEVGINYCKENNIDVNSLNDYDFENIVILANKYYASKPDWKYTDDEILAGLNLLYDEGAMLSNLDADGVEYYIKKANNIEECYKMTNKEIKEALNKLDMWAIDNDTTFHDLKTLYEAFVNPNSPVDQKKKEKIQKALNDPNLNKDKEKLQDYIAGVLSRKEESLDETLDDDNEFDEFVSEHPEYNKKFDKKRFGKFFDKQGKLIPEKKLDFWDEYDKDTIKEGFNPDSEEDINILYDIADRYCSSYPVSGSWDDETETQLQDIMDTFDVSRIKAIQIMKDFLGFEDEQLQDVE